MLWFVFSNAGSHLCTGFFGCSLCTLFSEEVSHGKFEVLSPRIASCGSGIAWPPTVHWFSTSFWPLCNFYRSFTRMSVHVYCVCVCACSHVCVCEYMHECMRVHVCVCVHAWVHAYMCVCVCVSACVRVCLSLCVCRGGGIYFNSCKNRTLHSDHVVCHLPWWAASSTSPALLARWSSALSPVTAKSTLACILPARILSSLTNVNSGLYSPC